MQGWSKRPFPRAGVPRTPGGWPVSPPLRADRRTLRRPPAEICRLHIASRMKPPVSLRTYYVTDDLAATPTDAELMARVAAGDEQAFAALYDRHVHAVYGAVMRYLRDPGAAEDVVQETYLAMWTRSDSYAAETGSLVGWLLTIARHRAIDRLRSSPGGPWLWGSLPPPPRGRRATRSGCWRSGGRSQ